MSWDRFADWMAAFAGFVWGTPTALLLTGAGLMFTLMTVGIQFKALTHGFAVIRGKYDNPEDEGNISHFQALCAALSATIGLGNISGVAVAVASGGPGAVFWMWVVGFLGMATKFTSCSLATMYRKQDRFGEYRGGPMYYIEMGLGDQATTTGMRFFARSLAILFAVLGMCASVGAGNMFQANQVAQIFVNLVWNVSGGVTSGGQIAIQMTVGAVLCIAAALVMIGGIKRIGNVASRLVPSMCIIYVLGALYIILLNIAAVPEMLSSILNSAFSASAGAGAFMGVATRTAIIQGVRRACFSNEAGLGSAPIAHATAKTNEPIREGVVAAIGPFVDTIVICTMTALVIMITGTHTRGPVAEVISARVVDAADAAVDLEVALRILDPSVNRRDETLFIPLTATASVRLQLAEVREGAALARGRYLGPDARAQAQANSAHAQPGDAVYLFRDGVNLTALAFDRGLSGFGTYFIPVAAVLFAFSTIISWGFYGETCTEYLFGERAVMPYRFIYVGMILLGTSSLELKPVLDWSDGMLGLMLVPNLIGTILLAPRIMRETGRYFRRLRAGEFDDEMRRAAESRRRAKARRDS